MFTAKEIKCFEHSHGIAWSVKIVKDGRVVGACENDGRGGANRFIFLDLKIQDEFEIVAKQKYPQAREPNAYFIEDLIKPLE